MDDPLTNTEIDTLRDFGYKPAGGEFRDGIGLPAFRKDGVRECRTRAEWRALIAELRRQVMDNRRAIYCPFCGSADLRYGKYVDFHEPEGKREWYQVECKKCRASGPRSYEFQDTAARLWNTRQIKDVDQTRSIH